MTDWQSGRDYGRREIVRAFESAMSRFPDDLKPRRRRSTFTDKQAHEAASWRRRGASRDDIASRMGLMSRRSVDTLLRHARRLGENTRRDLDESDRAERDEAARLREGGMSYRKIAEVLGRSISTLHRWRKADGATT